VNEGLVGYGKAQHIKLRPSRHEHHKPRSLPPPSPKWKRPLGTGRGTSFGYPAPAVRTYQATVGIASVWEGGHRLCAPTPEDYSPEKEVRKLRTKQKEEARGRREQAERRMSEQEEEALERREDAERQMRGRRNP
jgi:hypothetical protein